MPKDNTYDLDSKTVSRFVGDRRSNPHRPILTYRPACKHPYSSAEMVEETKDRVGPRVEQMLLALKRQHRAGRQNPEMQLAVQI